MNVVRMATSGAAAAEIGQQFQVGVIRHGAAHQAQHFVVGVLEGHVDVVAHFGRGRNGFDDAPVDAGRVAVEQAQPAGAFDLRQLL